MTVLSEENLSATSRCLRCGATLLSRGQRFCNKCGFKLAGTTKAEMTAGATTAEAAALGIPAAAPNPAEEELSSYQTTPPLRQLRADLGVGLLRSGKFREAAEMLERGVQEEGEIPTRFRLLMLIAGARESQGNNEKALSAYLEGALEQPQKLESLLLHAHRLLTAEVALSKGAWITRDWSASVKNLDLPQASLCADVAIFVARVNLFLGQYDLAVEQCREAATLSPERALELTPLIVAEDALPVAISILPRLYQALGRYHEALAAIDEAMRLGFDDPNPYPHAPLHVLRGEIYCQLDNNREAAKAFLQSGREYQWRGEVENSARYLRRSLELDQDYAPTHWYLSNTLYMICISADTETKSKLLEEAWTLWQSGLAIQTPDFNWSWVYVLGALSREISSLAPEKASSDTRELIWEAVTYIEQAILLDETDAQRWAYLGRYHNTLTNESTAVHATGAAMKRDDSDTLVLEERASILVDIGAFQEAEQTIERRREMGQSLWSDAVKALILTYAPQRRDEAKSLIEAAIEKVPDEPFYRVVRAFLYQMQGRADLAREDSEFILLQENRSDCSQAWAAYNLERFEESRQSFRDILSRDILISPAEAYRGVGLCSLILGDLAEARRSLDLGIQGAINMRHLDDFLRIDLALVERELREKGNGNEQAELLGWARNKALERRDQLKCKTETLEGPDLVRLSCAELQSVADAGNKQTGHTWASIAALAGLARCRYELEQWAEAAESYKLLLQRQQGKFPQATVGLERVLAKLVIRSDTLIREGSLDEAGALLGTLSDLVDVALPDDKGRAALHLRMGLIEFHRRNFPGFLAELKSALQLYPRDGEASPEENVAVLCRSLLTDPNQYWLMEDFLKSEEMASRTRDDLSHRIAGIRRSLAFYLDEYYQLSEQVQQDGYHATRQIVVEIAENLVPEDTGPEWPLFKTLIPQMRDRIERDTGVKVPGVRVWGGGAELPAGTYLIMLDEIAQAYGRIEDEQLYCPCTLEALRDLGIPEKAVRNAPHPVTGQPGCWITAEYRERVMESGRDFRDGSEYMICHLEAILRRNLADFLGLQEIEDLLAGWGEDEAGAALVKKALPDTASRFRFARALRELVKERVPVTQWKRLLEVAQETGLEKVEHGEAVRALRLALKRQLPGNDGSTRYLPLPLEVEEKLRRWIKRQNGRTSLAIPPEELLGVLTDIQELVKEDWKECTLVIQDPVVRPFVRRVLELECRDLLTLSREEMEQPSEGGDNETGQ